MTERRLEATVTPRQNAEHHGHERHTPVVGRPYVEDGLLGCTRQNLLDASRIAPDIARIERAPGATAFYRIMLDHVRAPSPRRLLWQPKNHHLKGRDVVVRVALDGRLLGHAK